MFGPNAFSQLHSIFILARHERDFCLWTTEKGEGSSEAFFFFGSLMNMDDNSSPSEQHMLTNTFFSRARNSSEVIGKNDSILVENFPSFTEVFLFPLFNDVWERGEGHEITLKLIERINYDQVVQECFPRVETAVGVRTVSTLTSGNARLAPAFVP